MVILLWPWCLWTQHHCARQLLIILNIIFSLFNSLTAHGTPASTVPKSCVYHPRLFYVNHGTAWDPTQNWARRTWPSDSVFADGVNSATWSAPFVCIPIGITRLTSEMKTADWTGFLKGSSCRNLKPFPSSRLVTTCQETFHRNPVNFRSFKSHLKIADRFSSGQALSSEWPGFFFFFPLVKPSMSAARVNLSTNHTYTPSLPKGELPENPGLGDSLNHHVYQSVGQRIRLEESNLFSFYYY